MYAKLCSISHFQGAIAETFISHGLPTLQQRDITATVLKMQSKKQLQIEKLHPHEGMGTTRTHKV